MNILEKTILTFCFAAIVCGMLGGSNEDCIKAALISAFAIAFLGDLHKYLSKEIKTYFKQLKDDHMTRNK